MMDRLKEIYLGINREVVKKLQNAGMKNTRAANRIALIVLLPIQLNDKLGTCYKTDEIEDYLVENAVKTWEKFSRAYILTRPCSL